MIVFNYLALPVSAAHIYNLNRILGLGIGSWGIISGGAVFPFPDIAFFAVKVYAHFEQLFALQRQTFPGQKVLFAVNLGQCLFRAFVQLKLKAVHKIFCLHKRVYAPGGDADF